jgi:hypothetical protein
MVMADLNSFQSASFLTPRWREVSRSAGPNQVVFRLGHYNPEVKIDKTYGVANKMIKEEKIGNVVETTSTVGITTAKGNNLTGFYEGLIGMVNMGYLPGYTVAQIEDLRAKNNVNFPEDCDYWADLTIINYSNAADAAQVLANIAGNSGVGMIDQKLPGGQGMSFRDALNNPMVRAAAKEKGIDQAKLDDALVQFEQASKEKDSAMQKAGMGYETGSFLGNPVVYMKVPKIEKPKPQPRKTGIPVNKITRPDGSVIEVAGGGGFDDRVKLPPDWRNKEELPIDGHVLYAMNVGPYVLTGGLLSAYSYMPTGKSFTQSLTKFKTETKTMREGAATFIDHFIVPEYSDFATEGYFYREEVEEMLQKLIGELKA